MRIDAGEARSHELGDAFIVERRVVTQPAPQQEVQPVLFDFQLPFESGIERQELAAPDPHVGAEVEAL